MITRRFDMWYDDLKEQKLCAIFDELSRIPRESGNEEGIRNFLFSWCKDHSLEAERDEIGNVIIHVPATKGHESAPSLAFQGHMDMVCVKRPGSKHDFGKDPIEIIREGNIIRAKDTTLGGDNGIAIAMMLDIFTDESLEHGPLEGIITIEEETGLKGAFNIDKEKVRSRLLLNLDSEEEGIIYIGCAGGLDMTSTHPVTYVDNPFGHTYELSVSGLLGGHSGGDIHKERGNAIKIASRVLSSFDDDYAISSFSAGTKRNVIPSSATVKVSTDGDLSKCVDEVYAEVGNELKHSDGNVVISIKEIQNADKVVNCGESREIIELVYVSPYAVNHMSSAIKGIVETSNNVAIATLDEEKFTLINSIRSNIGSAKDDLARKLGMLYAKYGFESVFGDGYPEWEPNLDSKFLRIVKEVFKKTYGKDPVVTAIHAGLECGILNKRIEGMDSISIGPNLFDVHSVDEHIEIDSLERTIAFVRNIVKSL